MKPLNLSDETIKAIYEKALSGNQTQKQIGAEFGISHSTVCLIKKLKPAEYKARYTKVAFVPLSVQKAAGRCCVACGIFFKRPPKEPGKYYCWYCAKQRGITKNVVNDMTDENNFGQSPISDPGYIVSGLEQVRI